MKPFSNKTTEDVIAEQKRKIENRIENLTDAEIMANDTGILAENLYQEFYIAPVTIHEEDFSRRKVTPGTVKRSVDSYRRGYLDREKVDVDGVIAEFHYPFDGESELFRCKASTFCLGGYPQIELYDDEIVFEVKRTIDEAKHTGKDKLISSVNESLQSIKQGIAYANADINHFNEGLKLLIWKLLNAKKTKVETVFDFAKMLEVPIEKKDYALKHIPVQRRIIPIAHKYNSESYYGIKDNDYIDILSSIKHILTTYEQTPGSFKSMHEEDLRSALLAGLNGIYKGDATGETFRKKGKTDIRIERENRAAFVAECKMWTGQKEIGEAINQLDGYLTWRDCKTALIYFVRNKDFISVLGKAKLALSKVDGMRNICELDKNEFECFFSSKSNIGQLIKIRVMLFDLYSE